MIWLLLYWLSSRSPSSSQTGHAEGRVHVRVVCDTCRHEYGYVMVRSASHTVGGGSGVVDGREQDHADEAARSKLERLHSKDFAPVPCPSCGDYQPEMVEKLRDQHLARVWRVVASLMIFSPLLLTMAMFLTMFVMMHVSADATARLVAAATAIWLAMIAIGSVVFGMVLYFRKRSFRNRLDPNDPAKLDDRLALAAKLVAAPDGN